MITLRQISATHIDRFSAGDKGTTSELSYQDTIFKVRSICNELIKAEYISKYAENDRSAIGMCIASYELSLVNDPDCAYVNLPDFYLNLPYSRGINRVIQRSYHDVGNPTDKEFTLSHQPAIGLKTRTARMPEINICWLEGLKLKFFGLYAEPGSEADKIIVQLIVAAPDSILEDDPLPIPPELVPRVYDRLEQMEINPGLTATQSLSK